MTQRIFAIATDGSPNSMRAMKVGADLASACGAKVIAVHVFEPLALLGKVAPPVDFASHARHAQELLDSDWTEALREGGVAYETYLVEDAPAAGALAVATAEHCDLIVIGARGLSPLRELLVGSTTQRLLEESSIPVVVVPHSE